METGDDKLQVSIQDRVLRPVNIVFNAIVDPEKLTGFFISRASGPVSESEVLTWHFDDAGASVTVRVKEVKQNELIRFEWSASGISGTEVNIVLEAIDAETTHVKITETGWPVDKEGAISAMRQTQGWTDFLCSLKAYLYCGIRLRDGRTKDIH